MVPDCLTVKRADSSAEREAAFALRLRVFVHEQGVPIHEEIDEHDASAVHVVALADGRVVATGRAVFPSSTPPGPAGAQADDDPAKSDGVRIGRMAVARAWRRRGVGGRVLAALESEARSRGVGEAVLAAQTQATRFYESHGYRREGSVFLDAGIDHVLMRKRL